MTFMSLNLPALFNTLLSVAVHVHHLPTPDGLDRHVRNPGRRLRPLRHLLEHVPVGSSPRLAGVHRLQTVR